MKTNKLSCSGDLKYMLKKTIICIIASLKILGLGGFFFPPGVTSAEMPLPITCRSSYIQWLERTGRPAYSRYSGHVANYEVFRKYKLLSYGEPGSVPGNRYDPHSGEYEAHGYSYDEYILYNTFFPEDYPSSSDPRTWNRINLGTDAAVSWMRLTAREKEHVKAAIIYYMGNDYGGMNFTEMNLTEQKCIVLSIPSLELGFALHTYHYSPSGALRYATFHGDGIGDILISGGIEPLGSNFTIKSSKDYIDIDFEIGSVVEEYLGLALESDLAGGGIKFGDSQIYADGPGPWNMLKTMRYRRDATDNTENRYRFFTEKAYIWAVTQMGDLITREVFCYFVIVQEPKSIPKYGEGILEGEMSMKGDISFFSGQESLIGYPLPYNPLRFLSLEKAELRIDFTGDTIPERVMFYPVGSSAKSVQVVKVSENEGYAILRYVIGVIPSTLNWSGDRVNPSLSAYASVNTEDTVRLFILDKIEITGTIYDIVYLNTGKRS